jgi:hypothetical protein
MRSQNDAPKGWLGAQSTRRCALDDADEVKRIIGDFKSF